jgi:hypothetical protein
MRAFDGSLESHSAAYIHDVPTQSYWQVGGWSKVIEDNINFNWNNAWNIIHAFDGEDNQER